MALQIAGAYSWLKKVLIAGLILLLIGAGVVWYLFTDTFSDTAERKPDFSVKATELITEFEDHLPESNTKYAEKIIEVNGIVSDVEAADTTVNLKMSKDETGSYLIFAFQKENQADVRKLKQGEKVSVKGSCSGGSYSKILEAHFITFKRSVLVK